MSNLTLLPLSPAELENGKLVIIQKLQDDGMARDEAKLQLENAYRSWLESEITPALPELIVQLIGRPAWMNQLNRADDQSAGQLYKELGA